MFNNGMTSNSVYTISLYYCGVLSYHYSVNEASFSFDPVTSRMGAGAMSISIYVYI